MGKSIWLLWLKKAKNGAMLEIRMSSENTRRLFHNLIKWPEGI